jgi:hypothetical protein
LWKEAELLLGKPVHDAEKRMLHTGPFYQVQVGAGASNCSIDQTLNAGSVCGNYSSPTPE